MGKTTFTKDGRIAALTIERVFDAPRERVWNVLTNADMLDQLEALLAQG
jgi:uncharacterized protein YndB with AHSA1/START domain